jgi:Domain of unknown function (DU1801)
MAKATAKTTETKNSVSAFLKKVADETKRKDSLRLVKIMEEETGFKAKMWGPAIVGFGSYHYKYESGHEGDAPLAGFSPRANALTLYIGLDPVTREKMLSVLGKHKTSKGCIYVKKLEDIDEKVLRKMAKASVKYMQQKYPAEK